MRRGGSRVSALLDEAGHADGAVIGQIVGDPARGLDAATVAFPNDDEPVAIVDAVERYGAGM